MSQKQNRNRSDGIDRQLIHSRMKPDLKFLAWNISGICNLTCSHCYLDAGFTITKEPPLEAKKKIVSEAKNLGVQRIFLAGGEPLLSKDIWQLLLWIKQHDIEVCVNSNGTFLNTKMVQKLVDHGVRDISIGIDSIDHRVHDKLRGDGNLAKTEQGVKECVALGISVNVDFTLTSQNYLSLEKVPLWARNLGSTRITLKRFVPRGRPGMTYGEWELDKKMLRIALTKWAELMDEIEGIELYSHDPLLLAYLHSIGRVLPNAQSLRLDCNAGAYKRGWLGISPNGDILPCPIMTEVVIGNIKTQTLEHGLEAEPSVKLRNFANDAPGKCYDCPHLSVCRGGCKAYTCRVTSNYYEPDPLCWLR